MSEFPVERPTRKFRTRARIMSAALAEFTEKGIAGTHFDEIARRAGIARRTLYYHFENKHSLLHAMVDPGFEAGIAQLRDLRANSPRLGEMARFCIQFRERDPQLAALFGILYREKITGFSRLHGEFIGELASTFHHLDDRESLRYHDDKTIIRIIFHSLFPLLDLLSDQPDYHSDFIDIFVHTLQSRGHDGE